MIGSRIVFFCFDQVSRSCANWCGNPIILDPSTNSFTRFLPCCHIQSNLLMCVKDYINLFNPILSFMFCQLAFESSWSVRLVCLYFLGFTKLTSTDPSKTAASTFDFGTVGLAFGISLIQFIKSDLFPERIWLHFIKAGGSFRVSLIHITTPDLCRNTHLWKQPDMHFKFIQ